MWTLCLRLAFQIHLTSYNIQWNMIIYTPIFSLSRFSRNTVANSLYSHQEETINYRYYRYKDLQLPDRVAPNVANERGQ